ncbi:MAG: hypothetical protein ACLP05_05565 [Candidatus Kryptoniota bacterium]
MLCQFEGKSKILDLNSNIRTLAAESLTDWRDKNIFPFHLDDIRAVDFAISDTLYHFFHRDTTWQLNGNNMVPWKAEDILGSFIGMNALGFIDSSISGQTELLDYGISFVDGSRMTGKVMKLTVSGLAGQQVCISNSANNQIYIISSVLPDNLERGLREIKRSYSTKKSI